jgi:hypothetical protein
MARSFAIASSQYCQVSSAVMGTVGSVGFFFRRTASGLILGFATYHTSGRHIIELMHILVSNLGCRMYLEGPIAGRARWVGGYSTTSDIHHCLGTWANDGSAPSLWLDGVAVAGGTQSGTALGAQTLSKSGIGMRTYDSANTYQDGDIWDIGIWNVQLGSTEAVALSKGFSPNQIRPASLTAYYPCGGAIGKQDIDLGKGGLYPMTPTNSPTWSAHGRTIYPIIG